MKRKERHIAQSATAEEEQRVTEENVNSGRVSMTEAVTTVVEKECTISDEMRRLEENIGMAEADAEGAAEEEEKRRRTTQGWGPCGGGGCGGREGECGGCGEGGGEAIEAAAIEVAEADAAMMRMLGLRLCNGEERGNLP
ncbi:hypothetical protein LR48_Vigan08g100500 [Vigna angularis]|uniref:Uncharacterized protein n=1 Tax=Phaseolus angularis TaxID=3914 RepID=A0A0L9V5D9_PHAAN|nr:hypothetical protein LR48_Vigan08g100500 [Vigna angularis]